jgi:transcriptional regulator with XRE-family HTH domain
MYREKLFLDPAEVAVKIRSSSAMIKHWERGKKMEQLENYLKLSKVLDCRVDQLINYDYPINNKSIKSKIEDLRIEKGYEEKELSDRMELEVSVIKEWEREESLKELKKWLDLYYYYLENFKEHFIENHMEEYQQKLNYYELEGLTDILPELPKNIVLYVFNVPRVAA